MQAVRGQWGRRKPGVHDRLNIGHPLTRGLTGCWLLNEGGGNKLYNHAKNNYSTINLPSITWVSESVFGGWALRSVPTASVVAGITIAPVITANALNGVAIEAALVDLGSDATALLLGNDGILRGLYLHNNKLNLFSGTGADADSTGSVGQHRWRHVVATAASNAANHEYYFDGDLDSSIASSFGTVNYNVMLNNVFATDETFVGGLAYLRVWDRGLLDYEVRELRRDPFAMFDVAWRWQRHLGAASSGGGPGGRFFPFFH